MMSLLEITKFKNFIKISGTKLIFFSATDQWMITKEDRAKHDAQFAQLNPVNGLITGIHSSIDKKQFIRSIFKLTIILK